MGWIIIVIIVLMLVGSAIIVVVTRKEELKREERRRRFELEESGERVPLVDPGDRLPAKKVAATEETDFVGRDSSPPKAAEEKGLDPDPVVVVNEQEEGRAGPLGRLVNTPEGEAILTTPPFTLRGAVFSRRHGRYSAELMKRIPPWLVVAPRARLDTILTPIPPDGRDAEDWRNWRRRVRLRSVDLLLCDRRSWRPILAIIFDRHDAADVRATEVAGGKDRIVDEILTHVGLPFLRATGRFKEDWHVIRPYVEHAMLPSSLDDHYEDDDVLGGTGWDASSVVNLLRADDEKGWMLE